MSKKSYFKGFGKKVNLPPEPRSAEEIKKDYDQAAYVLGQLEYLVYAKTLEAEDAKKKLLNLNQEFYKRSELDKANAPKTEGASNEPK